MKKVKKGRKKKGERVRLSGKEGGQEKRKGEGEDTGQHINSRAKSLDPLGGKAELREGQDSHTSATSHAKRRQKCKILGNFCYSKILFKNHLT